MAPNASQSYAFISVDGHGKPNPADRRLVRQHCMYGKNLRIGVHPVLGPMPWEEEQTGDQVASTGSAQGAKARLPDAAVRDWNTAAEARLSPPPPSDLSLFKFAGEVDDHSRMLIFNCTYFGFPAGNPFAADPPLLLPA